MPVFQQLPTFVAQHNLELDIFQEYYPLSDQGLWPILEAGMIGFITLQQSAPSQMTWQDSNAFREH